MSEPKSLFLNNIWLRISYLKLGTKIFLGIVLLAGLFLTTSVAQAATSSEPYSVLVVAGQSNAQGDNSFFYQMNPPLGSHPADNATKIMWSTGDNQLTVKRQNSSSTNLVPLSSVQPSGFFGPEIGLARGLWDQGRRNMVILKVTYGLQRLAATPNGAFGGLTDWNVNSVGESYDNLKLKKSQLASIMQNNGDTYTMDGFYWVQGESDAVKGVSVASYQNDLTSLLNSVKTDLGMHPEAINVLGKISGQYCLTHVYNIIYNPNGCGVNLCVIAVHPCSSEAILTAGNNNVRQAIQHAADTRPKTFVVETEDLQRVYDFVHMSAASQLTLGKRMSNSGFVLPFREEGSNDYDNDGIFNTNEDANGNGNLGDDDTDSDGIPDYLDDFVGPGGGREKGIDAIKSVADGTTGNQSITKKNSVLNWNYSVSNNASTPASIEIEDHISARQNYINGSLTAPPNFIKSYSTNNGNTYSQTEPGSGTTDVKVAKNNVPISATGDSTEVLKQADSYTNSTSNNQGYIPILSGSRIFTLFNNTYAGTGPTANRYDIGCVEKVSGNDCAGYPKDFTDSAGNVDFISPHTPVHYLDKETERIFSSTQRNSGYGIICFDTKTNAMCAGQEYTELAPTLGPTSGKRRSRIQQISKIGSCLYTYDISLKVYSYDPITGATPCDGHTTKNLSTAYGSTAPTYNTSNHADYGYTGPVTQSEVIGTKIFIIMNYAFESNLDIWGCNNLVDICKGTRIICFDSTTTDGRCSNDAGGYFSNPRTNCYTDRFCKLQQPFIDKSNNAICAFVFREQTYVYLGIVCRDPLTGGSVPVSSELDTISTRGREAFDNANYLPTYEEVELTLPNGDEATIFPWKKAYLIASPRSGKAVCFNWTTNSLCADFGNTGSGSSRWETWINQGVVSTEVGLNGDTNDIGYVSDGAGCIWAKGESGDIWSFDSQNGSVPCRRFEESVIVQPDHFYCDAQTGHVTGWNEAKLQLPVGTSTDDLIELYATIKDVNGNNIVGYSNINLLELGGKVSTLGSLDLSNLSLLTYPILSAAINFKASNSNIFSGANATPLVVLTFNGDDPQICYQTRVEDACNITTPLTNTGTVQVVDENLDSRQVQLSATSVVQYDDGESCIPDVRVTTSSPPRKFFKGENITYSILVENTSNTDPLSKALNISLTNIIPSESTYISSSGGTLNGSTVSWPVFSLNGSASRSFEVTVKVGNVTQGNLLNTASAQLVDDPTASNNSYISSNEVGSLSIIGATAWTDTNKDGIVNNSEAYLSGVAVELYKGGVLVGSGTTNLNGHYDFLDLIPATDYALKFVKPNSYMVSLQDVGENDMIDSDIDELTFMTDLFSLGEGEINNSSFAGFYLLPSEQTPSDPDPVPEAILEPEVPNVLDDVSELVLEIEGIMKSAQELSGTFAKKITSVAGNQISAIASSNEKISKFEKTIRLPIFGKVNITGMQAYYTTAISVTSILFGLFIRELWKRHLLNKLPDSPTGNFPRKFDF